ncbi:MAG: hypothetical protein IT191_08470 [Microbacteriaceae bacterium]|nr:hypothetical protein [Cryobacterium sp.]MBX3103803.1 hypothetical protein [Cryobacterium sp.]MCC6377038.1 hypothetical protein [Microbacteriaceae bacterium]
MNFKSIASTLAAVGTTTVLTVALTGCVQIGANGHVYPAEARSNFLSACESQQNATVSMCERCFDAVQAEYTYKEFAQLDSDLSKGTVSDEDAKRFQRVIASCS